MKKFYKTAQAVELDADNWSIMLDGKPIVTPLKNKFILSSKELAEEVAIEWNAQDDKILPETMPLTSLANTVIDKATNKHLRIDMNEEVVKYASSDLVCYFAERPDELVEQQREKWLPLIEWIRGEFAIEFKIIAGIQFVDQDKSSLDKARKIMRDMSKVEFVVMQNLVAVTGSFVISLALLKNRINAEDAYRSAFVDDIYQIEKWGSDEEAEATLKRAKADIEVSKKFLDIS